MPEPTSLPVSPSVDDVGHTTHHGDLHSWANAHSADDTVADGAHADIRAAYAQREPDETVHTADHTLVIGDRTAVVEMNVATANTVTVPPNSSVAFPVGTLVEVCQVGAGATTITEGSGVTVQTPDGLTLTLRGQWSTVSLRQRATDEWVVSGDLEAS